MQRWEYIQVRTDNTDNGRVLHINDEYVGKQKIHGASYLNKLGDEGSKSKIAKRIPKE